MIHFRFPPPTRSFSERRTPAKFGRHAPTAEVATLLQFHLKGKHNQKTHGGNAAHVPDVTDTVKVKGTDKQALATDYMDYKGEGWLRGDFAGAKKWHHVDSLEVVSKGAGVGNTADDSGTTDHAIVNKGSSNPFESKVMQHAMSADSVGQIVVDHQDVKLKAIDEERGFNGKPHVVSAAEMDKYIADGEQELFRGIPQRHHAEAYRTGDHFVGQGISGNGTYTAYAPKGEKIVQTLMDGTIVKETKRTRSDAIDEASDYTSSNGVVMRMTLKKDAKVVKFTDVMKRQFDILETPEYKNASPQAQQNIRAMVSDAGKWAALHGYDAIDVGYPAHMVVLNRTAVRVQSTNHRDLGDETRQEKIVKANQKYQEYVGIASHLPEGDVRDRFLKDSLEGHNKKLQEIEANYLKYASER
jgi:hypothetical protein